MTSTANLSSAIDRYEAGADVPKKSIAGLSKADLHAIPVPGKWSIHQLVVHLYESDLVSVDRMRRVVAMEKPLLMSYDESAFIRALCPEVVDTLLAADGFAVNRRIWSAVLRALPAEAFERAGVHSERGLVTLGQFVEGYVKHLDHHMGFMREKLERLGR